MLGLEIKKTYCVPLYQLTKRKQSLLDEVYSAWKDMVSTKKPYKENRKLYPLIYSKYVSQASMAKPNDPIHLDTQNMFKIDGKFAGISVKPRLRIWRPFKTKQKIEGKVCDSKLLKIKNRFELHLTVSKEIEFYSNPSAILSVDMGEKVIATAVLLHPNSISKPKPVFMGRKVRGLRRHYAYLRKKLGERKLQRKIKKIGNTEQRKVNDILHKISRTIVNSAKANNAVILLGDLTGIRQKPKGKRFNRIVANMPFYKLTQYITYKANWEGIPVFTTKEWYSSKTCHRCGSENTARPHQGLFKCRTCDYECNADYNGAFNLAKRLSNYMFDSGVLGFIRRNQTDFFGSDKSVIPR